MLVSGCVVGQDGRVYWPQPVVVGEPVVYDSGPAAVMVPENYVEVDGVNVGLIGGQYYILSGGVWVIDREHYAYYHGWFRDHPGYWREHATRNELYRRDAHGHEKPFDRNYRGPAAHNDPRGQPGHDDRRVQQPGNVGQRPNGGPGQVKPQTPQQKVQPQQQPQYKTKTDKDQKPQ